jgi:RNA recognition motif-containing protein
LFEPCGEILNLNLLMRPDGKPKGIAFVKFGFRSALNAALELTGTEHYGRQIKVEEARGRATAKGDSMPGRGNNFGGERGNPRPIETNADIQTPTLFIGGLSFNSTQDSIR